MITVCIVGLTVIFKGGHDAQGQVLPVVYIYYCIRLIRIYYVQDDVRQVLGLIPETQVRSMNPLPNITIINRGTEAARRGYFGSVQVTFIAEDPDRTYADWGVEHKTYLVHNPDLSPIVMAGQLRLLRWRFTLNNEEYVYKIKPGSIVQRKAKRTTPRFG